MIEIRLDIPRAAPGLNGSEGLKRMHWSTYNDLRDRWSQEVMYAYNEIGEPQLKEPVEVTYRRSYWGQPMDYDNMAASFKPVGDALEEHVITDDSPDTIESLELDQFKVHKDEHPLTQIIIREVVDE